MTTWPSACRQGISVPFAEKSLAEAGRELGLEFHFEKLGALPSTSEAHRLVQLAVQRRPAGECGRGDFPRVFRTRCGHRRRRRARADRRRGRARSKTLQTFRETREGETVLAGSEERLRGFGVRTVPNLLFGGRVLVPGTVNVATYVHALDQALFPVERRPASEGEPKQKPTLH